MILAAGLGTRLKPLTDPVPKPMVPVLNTPVMEYSVKLLHIHGIKEIIANTHYSPHFITDYFGNGERFGVNLQFTYEEQLLGTAGGVRNNRHFLDRTFFVLSGDALTDINLSAMLKFHRENKALATIALKPVQDVSNYGVVVADETGRIEAFQEKPTPQEALSNVVNTGIYLFEPEIFELIPEGFYDFGRQLFPRLLEMKERFYGFVTDDYWCDIGTVEAYKKAQEDALNNENFCKMASADGLFSIKNHCVAGVKTTIDLSSKIGRNVFIGKNCIIDSGAALDNCIIWDSCTLRENVVVENAIIGMNCMIGPNTVIRGNSLVGNHTIIGKNILIDNNTSLEPNSILLTGRNVSA